MMVGPTRLSAIAPVLPGARAAPYSSSQITRSISDAPRPPYSFGHEIPTHPARARPLPPLPSPRARPAPRRPRRTPSATRSRPTRRRAWSFATRAAARTSRDRPGCDRRPRRRGRAPAEGSLRASRGILCGRLPARACTRNPFLRSVKRLVALDRHAMTVAALGEVVPHGVVLDAAVVPERDRVHAPAEAALELGRLDVLVEHLEHRRALGLLELRDPRREPAIDVERLLAGHGMRAHDRMLRARKDLALVLHAVAAAIDVLAVVDRGQRLEEALHRVGERVVRRVHAREERVAADGRQLVHVEDAAHGRRRIARDVRVPVLTRDVLAVLVGVDEKDLRMSLHERRRRGMHDELAEEPAERLVLVRREALVAEEDDLVLGERFVDLLERALVERLAEIDAVHFGADDGRQLLHANRLVRHGSLRSSG